MAKKGKNKRIQSFLEVNIVLRIKSVCCLLISLRKNGRKEKIVRERGRKIRFLFRERRK